MTCKSCLDPRWLNGDIVNNDPVNFIDPWGLEGYPYYPTWSDVQTASQDVVSATTEGVSAAIDLTVNGPAPASSTLQSAMAITAVPLLASYAPSAYIAAHNTLLQYAPQATAIAKALYDLEGPEGPSFISRSKEILDDLIKSMNEKCPNNKYST